MTMMQRLSNWGEALPLPDAISRLVIGSLVGRTQRRLAGEPSNAAGFARGMADFPIALHTDTANAQHYEVPASFFDQVLGPRRKYSCCFYADAGDSLAQAEETALALTAEQALDIDTPEDLARAQALLPPPSALRAATSPTVWGRILVGLSECGKAGGSRFPPS